MVITTLAVWAIVSILIGILILIWPSILNYAVAIWLIINGILQLLGGYL